MEEIKALFTLLRYIGENIALFSGGLFTGATLYICLAERSPRTMLAFVDLLALSRANSTRTNTMFTILAGLTGGTALLTYYAGGSLNWLAGGAGYLVVLALLMSEFPRITKQLHDLSGERAAEAEGRKLMNQLTTYFSALCMLGLAGQYFFIAQPL